MQSLNLFSVFVKKNNFCVHKKTMLEKGKVGWVRLCYNTK